MADTFVPPLDPAPGTVRNRTNAVWRSDFGDGYIQRSPRGINTQRTLAVLIWPGLSHADANSINTFFKNHVGEYFLYALPPFSAEIQWICDKWDRDEVDSNASAITAHFEQVFDLAPPPP
jgi:phage-related protein